MKSPIEFAKEKEPMLIKISINLKEWRFMKNVLVTVAILICSASSAMAAEPVGSLECSISFGGPTNPILDNKKVDVIPDASSTNSWLLSVSLDAKNGYTCKVFSSVYVSDVGVASTGIASMEFGLPSGETVKANTSSLVQQPRSMSLESNSGMHCDCITQVRK